MVKLSWRVKLYLFAALIAVLPIAIASFNMISITRDELKSSINDELLYTTAQFADEINTIYAKNWMYPLLILRNGLEQESLSGQEKASLLPAVLENSEELISLNLYFHISGDNFVSAIKAPNDYFEKLEGNNDLLYVGAGEVREFLTENKSFFEPVYMEDYDLWYADIIIPVEIEGSPDAYLGARLSLNGLKERVVEHKYNKNGKIFLINSEGEEIFAPAQNDYRDAALVEDVKSLMHSGSRVQAVKNYKSDDGSGIVGSYAFPVNLEWAVIAERDESQVYMAEQKMETRLIYWVIFGLGLSIVIVLVFSRQISGPITKLREAAEKISNGEFEVDVEYKANDEIGFLGRTLEQMGRSLKESFDKIAKQNRELEEYSKTLEEKVALRTSELKEKNDALEETLKKLKDTQAQLITQEKLASLGALTAGIAHEIQNPLNFVNNFGNLSVGLADELNEELANVKDKIDEEDYGIIEEILEDIKLNVTKISEHGKRAENIVKSMLHHSRGDKGQVQDTDFAEMVDEAANLAFHSMKSKDKTFTVEIEKEYDDIPDIKLNPQAMNRVVLNIVNNALYAMNDKLKKTEGYEPLLKLNLKDLGDKVELKIRDNGPGMPEKVKARIFEPFFTTKPTGEGTGLGLSLSYDIITKIHKGELEVVSEEGKYTEFRIILPK